MARKKMEIVTTVYDEHVNFGEKVVERLVVIPYQRLRQTLTELSKRHSASLHPHPCLSGRTRMTAQLYLVLSVVERSRKACVLKIQQRLSWRRRYV